MKKKRNYDHEERRIGSTGNGSLYVTLPATHCRELGVDTGDKVRVLRTKDGFVIYIMKK